ncbi:MAG: ABC transporter permease, partial [Gemmatimonadota bacterium]
MDALRNDLRYALRQLRRNPGFAAVAILTLALGIGANTAVFSVVNGVVLRPLPYPEPERVGYIGWNRGSYSNTSLSAFKYDYFRRHTRVFEAVATHAGWATGIGDGPVPDEVRGLRASEGFFRVAGIQPALGRSFLPEEERPGAPPVVVLSHDLWVSRLDADPDVLGRTVRLGGEPHTVVGILPADFRFPDRAGYTDFVVPYRLDPDPRDEGINSLAWARVRPGVTPARVEADLRAVSERFRREHPDLMEEEEVGAQFIGFEDVFVGGTADTLWILLGAVGFVLLIACANVANLVLARSTRRRREIAIRAAIGAGRGRVVRQLLTESLLLAAVAALLGLLLGHWTLDSLLALAPSTLPRAEEIGLDGRVLAFTAGVAIATGVLFGLTASFDASRSGLGGSLR